MKKLLLLISVLFLIACQEESSKPSDLVYFVPPQTAAILKTKNLQQFSEQVAKNTFLKENENLPFFSFFKKQFYNLQHIHLTQESLLCFNKIGRKQIALTLITEVEPSLVNTDSIQNKKVETFEYDTQEVKKYTLEDQVSFSVKLNDVFILSTSKLVLENIIRMYNTQLPQDEAFKKIYETASSREASLFINHKEATEIYAELMPNSSSSFLKNFTNWTEFDLDFKENSIRFNGVSTTNTKDRKVLDIFKGTLPQSNEISEITPLNATGFYAFTFDSFEQLHTNTLIYRKKEESPLKDKALFNTAKEIGVIYHQDQSAVILNATDISLAQEALASNQELAEEYREVSIYKFENPDLFQDAFFPLIKNNNLNYYSIVGHFFVFAHEMQTIENIIANFQNQTVLATQPYYQNTKDQLSDQSSLLFVGINSHLKDILAESVESTYKKAFETVDFKDYKVSALQLIQDNNFAHANAIFAKAEKNEISKGAFQVGSIKLKEKLATVPQFIEDWRSKNNDIAVQGESNTLYVYDYKGNLRWKKQLDGRILGELRQIDIYNNGRLQLAFATQNKFYIIDNNGNDVSPFPENFKDPITQPLAVFDYANNSKYRFIITQKNKVLMINKEKKTVKGFKFSKTKSNITQAPKHIRIGTKDYILIPEENGKLHILDRTGDTRINIKETIDFSANQWYLYNGTFTSTNTKGQLVQINESGKISTKDLKLSKNNQLDATAKTLVTFSENHLYIKGKEVELDFGLYSAPKIFFLNDKIYISITDTQTHKVYMFDSTAQLLSGFPVYGNSTISMENMDNLGHLEFTVKGEDDSILLYQLN